MNKWRLVCETRAHTRSESFYEVWLPRGQSIITITNLIRWPHTSMTCKNIILIGINKQVISAKGAGGGRPSHPNPPQPLYIQFTQKHLKYNPVQVELRWHKQTPHILALTCLWLHREVGLAVDDAVHYPGAVPIRRVVRVRGRHLHHHCPCESADRPSLVTKTTSRRRKKAKVAPKLNVETVITSTACVTDSTWKGRKIRGRKQWKCNFWGGK